LIPPTSLFHCYPLDDLNCPYLMRLSFALAAALAAAPAAAGPVRERSLQSILSGLLGHQEFVGGMFGDVMQDAVEQLGNAKERSQKVVDDARRVIDDAGRTVERWVQDGRDYIKQNDLIYELLSHPLFSGYQMRVTEPKLCDPGVQQYSGYLDVTDGKHLFYWFFESRNDPENDPLILWLSGGPGCSSSAGLLFELGPCSIADDGKNVTYNPHSWNTRANIIFLDQPVNVGFSYSSDGSSVNTSPAAGVDVYAFLELFLMRYPKYAKAPFHIAAESYGGTYAPNFASVIYNKNKELELAQDQAKGLVKINLASVMIGNGITNPYIQDATIPEFACDGPYPIYSDPDGQECQALRGKVPTCQRLIQSCYKYNSRLACVPAALYCNSQLYGPIQQSGLNPYDVRKTCNPEEDTSLCYKQMGWIETWMNNPAVKAAVGADSSIKFVSCNLQVNQAFLMQGDGMHNSAPLLTELVNDGIRLLIYAGNADYMCNFIGNEAWLQELESKFQEEFLFADSLPWTTLEANKLVGSVRTATGGSKASAGNVTFVTVFEAGHMVPFDQPEAALDLVLRWLDNISLTNSTKS